MINPNEISDELFNFDVAESEKLVRKLGLLVGPQMGMLEEGGIFDMIWNKFKTGRWFIILVPSSIDGMRVPNQIEMKFYPPKTHKNAGFEITFDYEHHTTLLFCHKKYMSYEQLEDLLAENFKPKINIPRNTDVISLKAFNHSETWYWIRKLDKELDEMQNRADTLHRPESIMFDILTKDPNVLREVQIYQGLVTLHRNIMDYVYKKTAGE